MWRIFTNVRTALRGRSSPTMKLAPWPTETLPVTRAGQIVAKPASSTDYVGRVEVSETRQRELATLPVFQVNQRNFKIMSTRTCGCDPEAGNFGHACSTFPACAYGKEINALAPPSAPKQIVKPCECNLCVTSRKQRAADKVIAEVRNDRTYVTHEERLDAKYSDPIGQVAKNPPPVEDFSFDKLVKPIATLPSDPKARKTYPIYSGVLAYFPDALVEVAHVSYMGNEQHHPGSPLHWDRSKSTDERDAEVRHLIEPLTIGGSETDSDGVLHAAKKAWRALADLQKIIEAKRGCTK